LEKLFHAKPQRGEPFFFAPLRLGEKKKVSRKAAKWQSRKGTGFSLRPCGFARKKWFHAKTPSRKGGYSICGKSDRMVIAAFSSPQAVLPASLGECLFAPTPGIGGVDRGEDCLNQDFQDFRMIRIMGDDGLEMGGTKNGAPTPAYNAHTCHRRISPYLGVV
jgi:hypothetical protein